MWQREVLKLYQDEIYSLQMALLEEEVNDSVDYLKRLFDDEETFKTRQTLIFDECVKKSQFLAELPSTLKYVAVNSMETAPLTSVIFFGDLKRSTDRALLLKWLRYFASGVKPDVHFAIVPLCGGSPCKGDSMIYRFMTGMVDVPGLIGFLEIDDPKGPINDATPLTWCQEMKQLHDDLNVDTTDGPRVSVNGQLFGPFPSEDSLAGIDIATWIRFEAQHRSLRIQVALKDTLGSQIDHTTLVAACIFEGKLVKLIADRPFVFNRSPAMEIPLDKVVHFTCKADAALVNMQLMLNPFSVGAAKFSAMLLELKGLLDASVVMNVMPTYAEIPAKALYRFREYAGNIEPILPGTKYALMFNVPAAWDLVEASDDAELDNMEYDKRSGKTRKPQVELRGLVADVETRIGIDGTPLPGVPIELYSSQGTRVDHALSISATGTAQLRALPSIYDIQLPENDVLSFQVPLTIAMDSITMNVGQVPVRLDGPIDFQTTPLSSVYQ